MSLSFTSLAFLLFLLLCIGLVRLTRNVLAQKSLLIVLSCFFYLTFGLAGVVVMGGMVLVDFNVGRRVGASENIEKRRHWLWVSLATNIGALAFFKYSVFLVEIVSSALHPIGIHVYVPDSIILPVGISYFTFAGMSYVLDVYYEKIEPAHSVWDYLCYLMYFPKLIAGPIVRAVDLLPQLKRGFHGSAQDFEVGCAYLLVGAFKKLVIADQLASHVGIILASPQHYNAFTLMQGMVGYTVQIYADFSGYSDMAIGCARLMGIRFPQNFLMPYSAVNIAEFWRRWHVTLSTWFRDYVFLPLEWGGRRARNANIRAFRNITITMLLCGLWHGASWNFLLWGGLHGVALAVYQVYYSVRRQPLHRSIRSAFYPGTLAARALTLLVVMIGWVLFGTQTLSVALTYLWRILTWSRDGVALCSPYILSLSAIVLLVHLLIDKDRNLIEEFSTWSVPARILTYASLVIALTCLVPSNTAPFAYLRF
jgi:alginate O-acetyltransferase complex protein AlgI